VTAQPSKAPRSLALSISFEESLANMPKRASAATC